MEKKKLDFRIVKYMIFAAALVLVVLYFEPILRMAGNLWGILFPLTLGCVLAYILNIIMSGLEKLYFPNGSSGFVRKSRRPVCVLLSIILTLGIVIFIVKLVLPELLNAIVVLGKGIPPYLERFQTWLLSYSTQWPQIRDWINNAQLDWENIIKNVFTYVTSGVGGILNSTFTIVGVLGKWIINLVISLIFSIYFLMNKETLLGQFKRMLNVYVKPHKTEKFYRVAKVAHDTFRHFIIGQCTEAVILGTLCAVGMLLLRFPYAAMVGTLVGATALLPIVGAYIGAAVGAFLIFTENPIQALGFLVFLVILQQIEGNLIYPKVVGSSIGLPGMWVLAAVTVGGGIGGIMGMLVGVPLTATVYKLLGKDVKRREKAAGKEKTEK